MGGCYKILKEDNLTINDLKFDRSNLLIFVVIFIGLIVIFSCGMNTVAAAPPGDTIYVNASGGNDLNDGLSWLNAKQSISNATGTVKTNGTVNIANGQYTGINNTNITISKNMTIQGQSETGTIINGTGTNWIFTIQSSLATVTIENLTFANCNNKVDFGGAINNYGTLGIINITFNDNTASAGGAIYNYGTLGIINSTFNNNTAPLGCGGAIANDGGYGTSTDTITNSRFNNNTASSGGAIYNSADGGTVTETINNSIFNNNIATNNGGAIYNDGISGTVTDTINNSTLNNNTATNDGGAICNEGDGNKVINILNKQYTQQ